MEGLGDDVYSNSQFNRYGQSHVPGDGGGEVTGGTEAAAAAGGGSSAQELTTTQGSRFLKEVEDTFHDRTEKYDMFLDLTEDFEAQRVDITGLIASVKELFQGHDNLIVGFNTFLPQWCQITGIDDEGPPPKITMEFQEALSFVNKVKERFQNDDHVYESFLDILSMYRKKHKGIDEVYHEVAALFDDQPDLLDEFTRFLPEASAVATARHASLGRNNYHRYDDDEGSSLKQPQMDKCVGKLGDADDGSGGRGDDEMDEVDKEVEMEASSPLKSFRTLMLITSWLFFLFISFFVS